MAPAWKTDQITSSQVQSNLIEKLPRYRFTKLVSVTAASGAVVSFLKHLQPIQISKDDLNIKTS